MSTRSEEELITAIALACKQLEEDMWDRLKRHADERTLNLMKMLVKQKFSSNPIIRTRLLATDPDELVEGNYWHDNFWGDCTCGRDECKEPGLNHLGKILMEVREELK